MSDRPTANLRELLAACNLLERAQAVDESMFQLQWGSAMVVVGIQGPALVIISPMFRGLPPGKEDVFCRRLLELNATLGGVASFALQPDGWVVLHGGRDVKGLDADELLLLVTTIAQHADHFDDVLLYEFYRSPDSDAAGDPEHEGNGELAGGAGHGDAGAPA